MSTILELTRRRLVTLRGRYDALVVDPRPEISMLASYLRAREYGTILAIERYRARNEHPLALDVHVRLGGGFPLSEGPVWPARIDLDTLLAVAEDSDLALEQLRERVQLYAAGAELHSTLDALVSLSEDRQRQLASVSHELRSMARTDERVSMHH